MTLDAYKAVYGKEPAEESNTGVGAVVGSRSMFGWKEEDGVVDNFPTDNSEKVFFGDSVLAHDEVHINPCHAWFVYTGFCRLASIRQTFHLVLVLFLSQLPKYGIPYRLTSCSLKHSLYLDVI